MRINFRNSILAPAVLAVASFAAVSAHAEATLKVPFSFSASGKTMPAGDYVVSKNQRGSIVTLRNKEEGSTLSFVAGPGDPAPNSNAVTLRFDSIGTTHELRTVQYGPSITQRLDNRKHSEHVPVETISGQ